jgi:hypothetical protein
MFIKLSEKQIKPSCSFLILFIVCISFLILNCEPTRYDLSKPEIKNETEELINSWAASDNHLARKEIIHELEKRKAVRALITCNYTAFNFQTLIQTYGKSEPLPSTFIIEDVIVVVQALGRLKDPSAIESLVYVSRRSSNKQLKLEVLQAYNEINDLRVISPISELLYEEDQEIRLQAIDTLGQFNTDESLETIFKALFDDSPNVRWKAVHTLGEIGNPKAIGPISVLLADENESVRNEADKVLKQLGVSEEKIADWRTKAEQISIEDVYRTKLAYQKAEFEKQELTKKLKSETDLKKQLEESLKNQETAFGKQKNLVESLYEKERQLKSKQAQLDITLQQSEQYQAELQRLNARVQSLNAELKHAKTQAATDNVKEQLDKTLEAKSKLEQETKNSQAKESTLREEITALNALAEKTRAETEAAKQEVIVLRNREKQLAAQVDELKQRLDRGMAPVLVVSKPLDGSKIESPNTLLHFIAVDDKGISKIDVTLNGNPVKIDQKRGLKIVSADVKSSKKIDVTEKLQLRYGPNIIKITATDTDGITKEELIQIKRVKGRGYIWAIIIGINQYQKVRNLKYAVNDAQAFKDYLKDYVGIPDERIFYLANQDATKSKIESLLGTTIKRKASKDDTVIIFYAGHGAVEPDPSNPDGDGFEKYLLPYEANLEDLYSTSISMNNIRTIFARISAERLIFIADTCYSGASGGRTMMASKTRANLSDKFYERISKGKGRVIISSCSANEISKEDDNLQHGVFSYYMLEGLKGRADQDGDGIITVSELFSYISRKVPQASAQDQHPVKKGETEGELVIGRTK